MLFPLILPDGKTGCYFDLIIFVQNLFKLSILSSENETCSQLQFFSHFGYTYRKSTTKYSKHHLKSTLKRYAVF